MTLAILANEDQKKEWLLKVSSADVQLIWVAHYDELVETEADAYFDLLFQQQGTRLETLTNLQLPVFINEVIYPYQALDTSLKGTASPIFRLNAWPTFLKREIVEVSAFKKEDELHAEKIFFALGWKYKFVPDVPGLVSARIIAMIINEAYFTLQEEVSTKEEIDVAMKLGTNYPYGPFEWSELIGLQNIYHLLLEMSLQDTKYQPADLLKKETEQQAAWH